MKKQNLMIVIMAAAVALVGVLGTSSMAQTSGVTPTVQTALPKVVVFDTAKFFKEYKLFKDLMTALQADVQTQEQQMNKEKEALDSRTQNLPTLKQNPQCSPAQYKQEEEDIMKKKADLVARVSIMKREFMEREAAIYNQVFDALQTEVQQYANARQVDLVLRVDTTPANPEDAQSTIRRVNNPVVWYRPNSYVDITPILLSEMNRRYNPAGGGAASMARPGVNVPSTQR